MTSCRRGRIANTCSEVLLLQVEEVEVEEVEEVKVEVEEEVEEVEAKEEVEEALASLQEALRRVTSSSRPSIISHPFCKACCGCKCNRRKLAAS